MLPLEVFTRIVTALDNPEGQCYVAAEALYHALGGKQAGYTPMVMRLPGGFRLRGGANLYAATHWYVRYRGSEGELLLLDPTVAQFMEAPDYTCGRGCGFLTRWPSRRAYILLKKAGL